MIVASNVSKCRDSHTVHCPAETHRRSLKETKIRRNEAAYAVRRRRPLAGLQEVEEGQIQTARDLVLLVFALPRLPDARSAWRRTRCRCPAGAVAPAGLLVMGSSSLLRFFDSSR